MQKTFFVFSFKLWDILGFQKKEHLRLQTVLCDWGYTGDDFANKIYELTGAKVQVANRSELHTFAVIPKRWIVERSFDWLDKCRRL